MREFPFKLINFFNRLALLTRSYFTNFKSKSEMSRTLWTAALIIKIIIHLESLFFITEQVLFQIVGKNIFSMQVVEDIVKCFLGATHLTNRKISILIKINLF